MSTLDRPLLTFSLYVVAAALAGDRAGPVVCPWRRLTGRRCPACGLTGSIARTARLDLAGALRRNPAGPLVVAAVLTGSVLRTTRHRKEPPPCASIT